MFTWLEYFLRKFHAQREKQHLFQFAVLNRFYILSWHQVQIKFSQRGANKVTKGSARTEPILRRHCLSINLV